MRKFLLAVIIVLACLIVSAAGLGIGLANSGPFHVDHLLFPVQLTAEQYRLELMSDPLGRVDYLFTLIERRSIDLALFDGTPYEVEALRELNHTVDQLLIALQNVPAEHTNIIMLQLEAQVLQLLNLVDSIRSETLVQAGIESFETKLFTVIELINNPTATLGQVSDLGEGQDATNDPIAILPGAENAPEPTTMAALPGISLVPFPPGSGGAEHSFFPLVGEHFNLACTNCHTGTSYEGLPTACEGCHNKQKPANHFAGACAACHTPVAWSEIIFSHTSQSAANCANCHLNTKPPNHFQGQCSACHGTSAWKPANFNHAAVAATDCQGCHNVDRPATHFNGQCSICHNTSGWKPATFSHAASGAADCQSCHNNLKPANHFEGQCSTCHNTTAWRPASFNHSAVTTTDCQSCHLNSRPTNHYQGQCSGCHTTTAWQPANFSHSAAGATDCIGCHTNARPVNHYEGQCSTCHSTAAWQPATFNHTVAGAVDCQSCHLSIRPVNHYSGQCSACHGTSGWLPANFSHAAAGATDCQSCHARPAGHYSGQCSACHNTSGWGSVSFDHGAAGATDCQACHTPPNNHFPGQCSQCHTTNGWTPANFSHTFPLDHGDANGNCSTCHPASPPAYQCTNCHDRAELDEEHFDEGIPDYFTRCMDCHADGEEPDRSTPVEHMISLDIFLNYPREAVERNR